MAEALSEYMLIFVMLGDIHIFKDILPQLELLTECCSLYQLRIGTICSYNLGLIRTISAIRTGDLDGLERLASNAVYNSIKTYGDGSYKSNRAIILYMVSLYLITGRKTKVTESFFGEADSPDYKFEQQNYQRIFPEGCSDDDVMEFIKFENEFYSNMLDVINDKESKFRNEVINIYKQRKKQGNA